MPARNTMLPYETTLLKSGVLSGGLPPLQWTFLTGLSAVVPCAPALEGTAAAAATIDAFARKRLRFDFDIATSSRPARFR